MIQVDTEQIGSFEALAVDLTPMLDILFIVLVFFMLTANPAMHALQVELPAKGAEQAEALTPQTRLQLTLFAKQQWALNDEIFTDWQDTQRAFKQAINKAPETEIIIATEKDASVERLLEVMAFLKQQNLQAAQIRMDAAINQ